MFYRSISPNFHFVLEPTNTVTFKEPPSEDATAKPTPQQTSTTNGTGAEKVHLSFDGKI